MLTQNPLTALSFIAAPALLTNATSSLTQSTSARMLATREAMTRLVVAFRSHEFQEAEGSSVDEHQTPIESQAKQLLDALHSIYLALGAFSAATLFTLIGAALVPFQGAIWFDALAFLGLAWCDGCGLPHLGERSPIPNDKTLVRRHPRRCGEDSACRGSDSRRPKTELNTD